VRLSKKDYESQRAKMYGPVDLWYHIDCFIAKRDELEFTTDMDPTKSVCALIHFYSFISVYYAPAP